MFNTQVRNHRSPPKKTCEKHQLAFSSSSRKFGILQPFASFVAKIRKNAGPCVLRRRRRVLWREVPINIHRPKQVEGPVCWTAFPPYSKKFSNNFLKWINVSFIFTVFEIDWPFPLRQNLQEGSLYLQISAAYCDFSKRLS